MTEPFQPAVPADHAAHDPMWMAALASPDPDLPPSERSRAETALETCGACADLLADLVAVSAAIPSAAVPARPREFTITAADAARLRHRGPRRWLAGIGSARDGISFPLAMGLTTLGIAGLLVATVPALMPFGAGGASSRVLSTVGAPVVPEPGAGGAAAAPAPAASAAAASAAPSEAPAAAEAPEYGAATTPPDSETTGEREVFTGDGGDGATDAGRDTQNLAAETASRDDLTGLSGLAVVAGLLLLAGLALFALRWTARRP